ncbi:hypothetical protein HHK36_016209 [Tetracentron sinense]|uniref:PRISE-like Rossmann-fold domain-containing protein n=1 Tax=Tetracentron sinense TaxID=13715 RepID=A0A834Z4W2_TETSI|nr:hypothetical protein HHK36_016209 [Tetracentron sinense]
MAGPKASRTEAVVNNVALICGVTGLVGKELARILVMKSRWKVYGIARKPDVLPILDSNYHFISCDLLDPVLTAQKLSSLDDITHIFWVTWASQFPLDSQECCDQNNAMMSNALNTILPRAKALKHVSLQTGTKHYISLQGPFEHMKVRYYDEDCPRISTGCNFYYTLEDLLKERLTGKVAWSVQRPGLILGSSKRTLFNFMGSLCVYGTMCRHLNLPFLFGGTRDCWDEAYVDGSDARLVAEQHIWASSNGGIYSTDVQAYNAINGHSFTWKEIWPALAAKFGAEVPEEMFSPSFLFSTAMANKGGVWEEIVAKEGLRRTKLDELANWNFLDILFRCPVKMLATRDKADRRGFTVSCRTLDSILYWIDFMREERLIP